MKHLLVTVFFAVFSVFTAASATAAEEPRALLNRINERLTVIAENPPKDAAELKKLTATLESVDKALAALAPAEKLQTSAQRLDSLVRRSREGSAKGNLGALRSALAIYYGDAEGQYPANLSALVPKYLPEIPALELPDHQKTNKATVVTGADAKPGDTGGWLYFANPASKRDGELIIDCTHTDAKGRAMSGF